MDSVYLIVQCDLNLYPAHFNFNNEEDYRVKLISDILGIMFKVHVRVWDIELQVNHHYFGKCVSYHFLYLRAACAQAQWRLVYCSTLLCYCTIYKVTRIDLWVEVS